MAMSQVFFSQAPLPAGATSRTFSLPTANSDGTGSRVFYFVHQRDSGALDVNGNLIVNTDTTINIDQLQSDATTWTTLATVDGQFAWGTPFQPDPAAGVMRIVNTGGVDISSVTVADGFPR